MYKMDDIRKYAAAALGIIAITLCLSFTALAQSTTPLPSTSPPTTQSSSGGKTFSENMAALMDRAGQLIPRLQDEVESPLLSWFEKISILLAAIIMMFSFARMWRESGGAGADIFWWFGRLAVCLAFLGSGPFIIDYANGMGKQIAGGNETIGDSVLSRFYKNQRDSFNQSYQKFTSGLFTVKVDGKDIPIKPGTNDTETILGVLYDKEAAIKDIDRKFDVSSWKMPTLFAVFSASRGIIEFGDLYLMVLAGFLMMAMRLTAPFMIAAAVDRNLAQRLTYPFTWGVIVLTLIWPVVSYLIRSLAYLAGNVAMALGDSQPLYSWDAETMQVLTNPQAQPVYTIVIAALIMAVVGLSLWLSPFIAYKISMGQVYESVSSVVSGWVGAIVGAGIELYSASTAAALNNQAERTQAQGAYTGEVSRATAGFEAGNLGVKARQIASIASAHGSQIAALGQIYGARSQAIMTAQAGMVFGVNSAAATTALSKGDIQVRAGQNVADLQVNRDQQSANIETNRAADTQNWVGDKVIKGSEWLGGATRNQLSDKDGKQTLSGRAVGSMIEVGGAAYGLSQQYGSIQNRASGQQAAVNRSTEGLITNQQAAATGQVANQEVYQQQMTEAHQKYAQSQIAAANVGASQSAGGVTRGTSITIGGINQGTALEQKANRVVYEGSLQSASQVRDATLEAARLRALSSVVSALGYNISRHTEQGLTLRY